MSRNDGMSDDKPEAEHERRQREHDFSIDMHGYDMVMQLVVTT